MSDRMGWTKDLQAVREERDDLARRIVRHKCRNQLSDTCNACGPMRKAWLLLRQMAKDLEAGKTGITQEQVAIMG